MQTTFTPEQLADPGIARSNEILRTCVHCGFCTATCPTYQVLGDELDSPRGRIYLIKDMLENGPAGRREDGQAHRPLPVLPRLHDDLPLGRALHASGRSRARVYREDLHAARWSDRVLRWVLAQVLPYPTRFRLALLGAKIGRPFAFLMPDARLRAMLAMAPKRSRRSAATTIRRCFPRKGARRMRVALMTGCAQKALNTDINDATIRLLTPAGLRGGGRQGAGLLRGADASHGQGGRGPCHGGARNIRAWMAEARAAGLDAIVINTSGCGTTVKDYGHMFRDDPLAARCGDGGGAGAGRHRAAGEARPAAKARRRACASPITPPARCSTASRSRPRPKDLLKRAGFEVVEPADSHLCCGSAGTYNLLQPEISGQLKARKVQTLEAKRARRDRGRQHRLHDADRLGHRRCRWCIRSNCWTGRRAGRSRARTCRASGHKSAPSAA